MAVIFFRTIIMYLLIIVVMRFTGKRQVGELQLSELVVTILISELAAIPMQDTSFRAKIAERKAATGIDYLSFYYMEASSYEIVQRRQGVGVLVLMRPFDYPLNAQARFSQNLLDHESIPLAA